MDYSGIIPPLLTKLSLWSQEHSDQWQVTSPLSLLPYVSNVTKLIVILAKDEIVKRPGELYKFFSMLCNFLWFWPHKSVLFFYIISLHICWWKSIYRFLFNRLDTHSCHACLLGLVMHHSIWLPTQMQETTAAFLQMMLIVSSSL